MSSTSSVRVIALDGELEIGRRDEIDAALAVLPGDRAVLVDFSGATYADSTTLASLVRFREEANRNTVRIALLVVHRQFARLVQYAGLGELFAVFADRGEALRELTRP